MAEKNILESFVDYLKPKAHDAIDAVTEQWEESKNSPIGQLSPELQETIQGLVMGGGGAGGMLTKTRQGLKSIPKAQWEKVFGSKVVDKASEGVRQLALAMKGKIKDGRLISDQPFKQGMIGKPSPSKLKNYSRDSRGNVQLKKPSFNVDVAGWKNVPHAQAIGRLKEIEKTDKGKWGLAGLLGLIN
mgnify:CR=1 FL=1